MDKITSSREQLIKLRERHAGLMRRFIDLVDEDRSDLDLVTAVYERFIKSRSDALIDPNE